MSSLCVQNFDLAPSSMLKGKPLISRPYINYLSQQQINVALLSRCKTLYTIPCPRHFDLEAYNIRNNDDESKVDELYWKKREFFNSVEQGTSYYCFVKFLLTAKQ